MEEKNNIWYHGDVSRRTNFYDQKMNRDSDRVPNAQGPGIYFTKNKIQAKGYAYPNGYIYTVRINTNKIIYDSFPKPNKQFIKKLMLLVDKEDLDYGLSNWGYDESDPKSYQQALLTATNVYNDNSNNLIDSALQIHNDIFRKDATAWTKAMVKCGVDAFLHKLPTIDHLIVYNPGVIEIIKEEQYERGKNNTLEEMSGIGAGAVQGGAKQIDDDENLEECKDYQTTIKANHPGHKNAMIGGGNQTQGSEPFVDKPSMKRSKSAPPIGENLKMNEEIQLRQVIRKFIKEEKNNYSLRVLEESKLRKYIRQILKEEKGETKEASYDSTGINVLKDLLKKIIPVIETDYKSLTSSPVQRESFRAHLLTSIQNTLMPSILTKNRDEKEETPEIDVDEEKNVDVKIGSDTVPMISPDPSGFIDISKKQPNVSSFVDLPGQDETGKNMALKTFDKVEKSILEAYNILADEKDEQEFYDYLITNLKLYSEKWSDELSSSVEEPTTPEYEEKKKEMDQIKSETDPNVVDSEMGEPLSTK